MELAQDRLSILGSMESRKVRLTEAQTQLLEQLPEQGMGYQLVDIVLEDGTVLKCRTVMNSEDLVVNENETIRPVEIRSITIAKA